MSTEERKNLKEHAEARNISLSYCIGLPVAYDIASEDAGARDKGLKYLTEIASGIGEMGGGMVSGIIYSYWPALLPKSVDDKRPYIDRSVETMRKAIKVAEDNNVIFNMEVVNRFEQYMMNTAAEAVEYVKRVDSPNAKILLDTFHMNIEEDTISGALETAGSYLGHIHLGENNRTPPPWSRSYPLERICQRREENQLSGLDGDGTLPRAGWASRSRHSRLA